MPWLKRKTQASSQIHHTTTDKIGFSSALMSLSLLLNKVWNERWNNDEMLWTCNSLWTWLRLQVSIMDMASKCRADWQNVRTSTSSSHLLFRLQQTYPISRRWCRTSMLVNEYSAAVMVEKLVIYSRHISGIQVWPLLVPIEWTSSLSTSSRWISTSLVDDSQKESYDYQFRDSLLQFGPLIHRWCFWWWKIYWII